MFAPEQNTFSVPSGNKTINCRLHVEQFQDRMRDGQDKDAVQVFWPATNFIKCCPAIDKEPAVCDVIESQNTTSGDGLLNIVTNFNNLAIQKEAIIEQNAGDIPDDLLLYDDFCIDLIQEYNDGMFYGDAYMDFTSSEYHYETIPQLGKPIEPEDRQKLLYLLACRRADNCNKYIERKFQFMGVMKTEAIVVDDNFEVSQKCTAWMGGVCDVWNNSPTAKKMIEVGNHLMMRMPTVIPDLNNLPGVIGETTFAEGMTIASNPIDKVMMILERYDDSMFFCQKRFMAKFVVALRRIAEPTYSVKQYYEDLKDDDFRRRIIIPFQQDFLKFQENYVGRAYANALYGQHLTIVLKSPVLY